MVATSLLGWASLLYSEGCGGSFVASGVDAAVGGARLLPPFVVVVDGAVFGGVFLFGEGCQILVEFLVELCVRIED